jgi:hypothetical protein
MEEEAGKGKRLPVPAHLAKFVKDHYGVEDLKRLGWDLSEAEQRYGADWLGTGGTDSNEQ